MSKNYGIDLLTACSEMVSSCPETRSPYDIITARLLSLCAGGQNLDLSIWTDGAGKTIQLAQPDGALEPTVSASYFSAGDLDDPDEAAFVAIDVAERVEPVAADFACTHPSISALQPFFVNHPDDRVRAIATILADFADMPAQTVGVTEEHDWHYTSFTFDAASIPACNLTDNVDRHLLTPTDTRELYYPLYAEGESDGIPYILNLKAQAVHLSPERTEHDYDVSIETAYYGIQTRLSSSRPFSGMTVHDRAEPLYPELATMAEPSDILPFLPYASLGSGEAHFSGKLALRQLRQFIRPGLSMDIVPPGDF